MRIMEKLKWNTILSVWVSNKMATVLLSCLKNIKNKNIKTPIFSAQSGQWWTWQRQKIETTKWAVIQPRTTDGSQLIKPTNLLHCSLLWGILLWKHHNFLQTDYFFYLPHYLPFSTVISLQFFYLHHLKPTNFTQICKWVSLLFPLANQHSHRHKISRKSNSLRRSIFKALQIDLDANVSLLQSLQTLLLCTVCIHAKNIYCSIIVTFKEGQFPSISQSNQKDGWAKEKSLYSTMVCFITVLIEDNVQSLFSGKSDPLSSLRSISLNLINVTP